MKESTVFNKPNLVMILVISVFLFLIITNIFTAVILLNTKDSLNQNKLLFAEVKGKYEVAQKSTEDLTEMKDKFETLKKENLEKADTINLLNSDIATLNDRISQTQSEFVPQQSEPISNKTEEIKPVAQDSSPDSFAEGSSKDHVKKVMGTPDSIVLASWWYGKQSWVSFDKNGLVDGWYDGEGILKIE